VSSLVWPIVATGHIETCLLPSWCQKRGPTACPTFVVVGNSVGPRGPCISSQAGSTPSGLGEVVSAPLGSDEMVSAPRGLSEARSLLEGSGEPAVMFLPALAKQCSRLLIVCFYVSLILIPDTPTLLDTVIWTRSSMAFPCAHCTSASESDI